MKTIHLFQTHGVEFGCTDCHGRPSYRWVNGYAQAFPNSVSQALPMKEWQAIARRDGMKIKLHRTTSHIDGDLAVARKAMMAETT